MRSYTILASFALSLEALSVFALRLPPQAQADIYARDDSISEPEPINMLGLPCNITCAEVDPNAVGPVPLPPITDCNKLLDENNSKYGLQEITIEPGYSTGCFPTHPLDYGTTLTNV
jgi:hypothetical protein